MTFLERLRTSTANAWLQRVLRPLQFLSSVLSLGFFSARLARILRLARSNYNHGEGAVEGILAAAVLYNLLATLLRMCLKHGGPTPVRWFLVVADVLFIGGFIAVAALTRPRGGSAGPNGGDCGTDSFAARAVPRSYRNDHGCNLPWGTFVLAIISTILHALTAALHERRDHRREAKSRNEESRIEEPRIEELHDEEPRI